MRIVSHFGHSGIIKATRKELEQFFPEGVIKLLPEGERSYAFGLWDLEGVACPTASAKIMLEPGKIEHTEIWDGIRKFDAFCANMVREQKFVK